MGRRLTLGAGAVSVVVDEAFDALLRRALNQTVPGIADRLEETADGLYQQAFAAWPVRTGRSRAGLAREVRVAPDLSSVRARLLNDVDYAKFIRSNRISGSGSAFVELMRRPTEEAARDLAEDLRPIIERTLSGES